MSKNVLFITEGKNDTRFLKALLNTFRDGREYEVFVYNTSIHELLERLMSETGMDDDVDFMMFLKGCNTNKEQYELLDRKFTDIFLIFDMDPHHQRYDPERLKAAMEFFSDSTVNGKLYLNYPMLESFRHIPDPEGFGYLDLKVFRADIGHNYKGKAASEGSKLLSDIAKIDITLMERILILNLMKSNMIMNGCRILPDAEIYLRISGVGILEKQTRALSEEGWIYVLNTSVFIVVDYSPEAMLGMLGNDYKSLYGPVDHQL